MAEVDAGVGVGVDGAPVAAVGEAGVGVAGAGVAAPASRTTSVPFMLLPWTLHTYGYSPGVVGAVKVPVWSWSRTPLVKSACFTPCGEASRFWTVTVAPGVVSKRAGEKENPGMVMSAAEATGRRRTRRSRSGARVTPDARAAGGKKLTRGEETPLWPAGSGSAERLSLRRVVPVLLALLVALPALSQALPTPGFNGALSQATVGRVFPEPLQTNDFIGYDEAVSGLRMIADQAPDRVTLVPLGETTGWVDATTGQRRTFDLFAVEVTDKTSLVPDEAKLTLVFFLSIHGNEKGAREGGLRVIEDLAFGIGLAEREPDLVDMLRYQKLVLIFANSDGWTREDPRYRSDQAAEGDPLQQAAPNFARENGHFYDLNRGFPTVGYLFEEYTPLSEPENRHMVNYTKTLRNVVAGGDMHGMMENTNLVRILLKDGEKDPEEQWESERLAELYKQRLNDNPHYDAWAVLPDQKGYCCGQVAQWAATFDAIGYAASGTAGGWIVQRQGLDAPGYTVEFAYNHLAFDSYYPGPGALFNDLHVEAIRDAVSVFMRFAAEDRTVRVDAGGHQVAVLRAGVAATSEDDAPSSYEGWFALTDADDAYDIAHRPFAATPDVYWQDLSEALAGGALDAYDDAASLRAALPAHDTVVVPGGAAAKVDAETARALRAFVEGGGNLVLADGALALLEGMGVVPAGSVDEKKAYSGYTDLVDREHPLAATLAGFPRQTYDPNPLGFPPGESPVWSVDRAAWEKAGGVTVGAVSKEGTGEAVVEDSADCGRPQVRAPIRRDHDAESRPASTPDFPALPRRVVSQGGFGPGVDCGELAGTNVGVLSLGEGKVHVFGAILPSPSEAANHPYGLDDHAVSAAGNHLLLAMMGMDFAVTASPAEGTVGKTSVPPEAPGDAAVPLSGAALVVAAALAGLAATRRRPKA